MTPVTSKIKKYKIKGYSSYKSRFKLLNDGTIRRWREGKWHNAHLKLHVTKSNDELQCKAQFVKSQLCNFHQLWSTVPEDSSHCHGRATTTPGSLNVIRFFTFPVPSIDIKI
ncbi:uncharacterized protein LOC112184410 isoform X2 [Rosa chinensis]|uniref:uncharacterized protein LOC112184410 isoform X2 n=1 Tax=Rosa chinensis TaxID=74649 RepID=UPI000D08CEC6|nr:uncharacterized protein LOC112184410 isoform X2 [Rosa chinensis]